MDNDQTRLNIAKIRPTMTGLVSLLIFSLLLIGCETTKGPAPVMERAVVPDGTANIRPPQQDPSSGQFYIVQRGDTLYSIALRHNINPRELAEWNNIADPHAINVGQRLNLSLSSEKIGGPTLYSVPQHSTMPILEPGQDLTGNVNDSSQGALPVDPASGKVKASPKALKLPYSEQNVAVVQHSVNPSSANIPNVNQTVPTGTGTRIETAPNPHEQVAVLAKQIPAGDWMWPTNGTLVSSFSSNSKGLKISGQMGQPVVATAAGEVVYSGDGLRGYGNLIIIKHTEILLSAYAHNSKLLVKEGELVSQGQVIAEMGNTDTDKPQLHFEIRRHGKPVDPLEFLPANPG